MSGTEPEMLLLGGRANVGNVVRVGDEVARPAHPQAPFVDHFLAHLRAKGLTHVPAPRGRDSQGRQRLSFINGVAARSPYPRWAFDDDLLVELVALQRQIHRAAADYQPPAGAQWATSGGNYFPASSQGTLFCHNDFSMSNVIVAMSNDRPHVNGVVDFDYVAPVDRLFDIAVLARHWVPFAPNGEVDCVDGTVDLDVVKRFALIGDGHGLNSQERGRVLDLSIDFLNLARTNVRALADAGNPGFRAMIANGYEATNQATVDWIVANRSRLAAPRPRD